MRVCIFGLPKTGTTGLYGLIKNGVANAGLNPISTFEPPALTTFKSFFMKANPDANLVTKLMVKDKYFEDPKVINQFSHKVMIVRDPRDRAISRLLFRPLSGRRDDDAAIAEFADLLRKKEADPKSISFVALSREADRLGIGNSEWDLVPERMAYQIERMEKHRFHRILYEDFVAKNYAELSDYLGIELEGNQAKNESWLGHITRSKSDGAWRNWLTEEDVDFIRPIFKPYMDHFGYDDDWEIPGAQSIAAKASSEYVVDRYAKRKKEFSLMKPGRDEGPKNDEDFKFYLGRAEDGRGTDIWLVANYYLRQGKKDEAFKWFEIGFLLGSLKCRKEIEALFNQGYRSDIYRTKFAFSMAKSRAKADAAERTKAEAAAAGKAAKFEAAKAKATQAKAVKAAEAETAAATAKHKADAAAKLDTDNAAKAKAAAVSAQAQADAAAKKYSRAATKAEADAAAAKLKADAATQAEADMVIAKAGDDAAKAKAQDDAATQAEADALVARVKADASEKAVPAAALIKEEANAAVKVKSDSATKAEVAAAASKAKADEAAKVLADAKAAKLKIYAKAKADSSAAATAKADADAAKMKAAAAAKVLADETAASKLPSAPQKTKTTVAGKVKLAAKLEAKPVLKTKLNSGRSEKTKSAMSAKDKLGVANKAKQAVMNKPIMKSDTKTGATSQAKMGSVIKTKSVTTAKEKLGAAAKMKPSLKPKQKPE